MKHLCQITIVAILLLVAPFQARVHAQQLEYDIDFVTNFDNREYHSQYADDGTIFGIRLTPTIGLSVCDSLGGRHVLMGGVSYIQPFGVNWKAAKVTPTVYYQYQLRKHAPQTSQAVAPSFTASLGFIPYNHLTRRLPKYLMSDSLDFVYPNIQGALFQYSDRRGYVDFFCDWRGMPTATTREAFRLVVAGEAKWKMLRVGGYGQLNHLANYDKSQPRAGVCDDAYANPYIGVDASHLTVLDSLRFDVGYLFGYQCQRAEVIQPVLCHGMTAQFTLRWRWIELDDNLYVGQNQMPHYGDLGAVLNQGEPFYQSPIYNSAELRFRVLRHDFAQLYLAWNMIYCKGEPLSHQQRVVLRFNLNRTNFGRMISSRKK